MTAEDREVLDRLIRIETMLTQMTTQREDHEARLRVLEREAMTAERVASIAEDRADARQRRLLGWLALVVAVVSSLLGAAAGSLLP